LIGIIGYGMGNLRSVRNALEHLGAACEVVETPQRAAEMERLVLPGVGAFGEGMRRLDEHGFAEALPELAGNGRPLLGICLGMQLLAETSSEHGTHEGLGLIRGAVERIQPGDSLRIPHVGWNTATRMRPTELFEGLSEGPTFYFVHSFELRPTDPADLTATTDYGCPLSAAVESGSVYGVQFHPEKSQADGLALLRNFISL
jgi:glutamine amidotransferase